MRLLGAVVLALALAAPVSAAPDAFAWTLYNTQHDFLVEQQSPPSAGGVCSVTVCPTAVHNTLRPCFWDADDHENYLDSGRIDAGQTIRLDRCLIANDPNHGPSYGFNLGFSIRTRSPDLVVSIVMAGREFPAYVTPDGRDYVYNRCVSGPKYVAESPDIGPVGDGTGALGTLSLVIANPTGRNVTIGNGLVFIAQGGQKYASSSGGFRAFGGYAFCTSDDLDTWTIDGTNPIIYAD